ncbi:hypothetical protein ACOSP7_000214 [Xanthoceras sorbifolium]
MCSSPCTLIMNDELQNKINKIKLSGKHYSDNPFTKMNGVLKHTPSLQTAAPESLYSIVIRPPFAVFSTWVVFEKYCEGMMPSLIQFKSAPKSIKASPSKIKVLIFFPRII